MQNHVSRETLLTPEMQRQVSGRTKLKAHGMEVFFLKGWGVNCHIEAIYGGNWPAAAWVKSGLSNFYEVELKTPGLSTWPIAEQACCSGLRLEQIRCEKLEPWSWAHCKRPDERERWGMWKLTSQENWKQQTSYCASGDNDSCPTGRHIQRIIPLKMTCGWKHKIRKETQWHKSEQIWWKYPQETRDNSKIWAWLS